MPAGGCDVFPGLCVGGARLGGWKAPGEAFGVDDRAEQSGETCVNVLPAQGVADRGARVALGDQPGFAQHAEVVGRGGLAHRQLEGNARLVVVTLRELGDDFPPYRIGQCGQERIQGKCGDFGMGQLACHVWPPDSCGDKSRTSRVPFHSILLYEDHRCTITSVLR